VAFEELANHGEILLDALNAAGRTIVMVTHESDIAARAKRVISLRDGRIASDVKN